MQVMNDAWVPGNGLPATPVQRARETGHVLAGAALGFLIGLIGVALIAIFNRGVSRADMLYGSWFGAAVGMTVGIALRLSLS
jgi:hypothetical protein